MSINEAVIVIFKKIIAYSEGMVDQKSQVE